MRCWVQLQFSTPGLKGPRLDKPRLLDGERVRFTVCTTSEPRSTTGIYSGMLHSIKNTMNIRHLTISSQAVNNNFHNNLPFVIEYLIYSHRFFLRFYGTVSVTPIDILYT